LDKQPVQALVKGYSIETTVRESQRVERYADIVPQGTKLYIAHVPGTSADDTVALAGRLRREGMEPVPHIVARRIESLAALDALLGQLVGQAGVSQVLVVASASSTAACKSSRQDCSRSTASARSASPAIRKAIAPSASRS
jgi:methylenetetrahydrofolate reductase (NADPH)